MVFSVYKGLNGHLAHQKFKCTFRSELQNSVCNYLKYMGFGFQEGWASINFMYFIQIMFWLYFEPEALIVCAP